MHGKPPMLREGQRKIILLCPSKSPSKPFIAWSEDGRAIIITPDREPELYSEAKVGDLVEVEVVAARENYYLAALIRRVKKAEEESKKAEASARLEFTARLVGALRDTLILEVAGVEEQIGREHLNKRFKVQMVEAP